MTFCIIEVGLLFLLSKGETMQLLLGHAVIPDESVEAFGDLFLRFCVFHDARNTVEYFT